MRFVSINNTNINVKANSNNDKVFKIERRQRVAKPFYVGEKYKTNLDLMKIKKNYFVEPIQHIWSIQIPNDINLKSDTEKDIIKDECYFNTHIVLFKTIKDANMFKNAMVLYEKENNILPIQFSDLKLLISTYFNKDKKLHSDLYIKMTDFNTIKTWALSRNISLLVIDKIEQNSETEVLKYGVNMTFISHNDKDVNDDNLDNFHNKYIAFQEDFEWQMKMINDD